MMHTIKFLLNVFKHLLDNINKQYLIFTFFQLFLDSAQSQRTQNSTLEVMKTQMNPNHS